MNPALDFDFEQTKIFGSVVITLKGGEELTIGQHCTAPYVDLDRRLEQASELNLRHWFRPCEDPSYQCEQTVVLESPWRELGKLTGKVFQADLVSEARSYYCADDAPQCTQNPLQLDMAIDKVELKVMADMFFDKDNYHGVQNENTQVFTYLLYDADDNRSLDVIDFVEDSGSNWVSEEYDGYIHFDSDETIGPNHAEVDYVDGSTIRILGQRVDISGQLSVASGYELVISAEEEIVPMSGGSIGDDITLLIADDDRSFEGLVSQAYLSAYCQGQGASSYSANFLSPSANQDVDDDPSIDVEPLDDLAELSVRVYLNPSPGLFPVEIFGSDMAVYTVRVVNIQGQIISHDRLSGSEYYRFDLDIQDKATGMYIIDVISDDGHRVLERIQKL